MNKGGEKMEGRRERECMQRGREQEGLQKGYGRESEGKLNEGEICKRAESTS